MSSRGAAWDISGLNIDSDEGANPRKIRKKMVASILACQRSWGGGLHTSSTTSRRVPFCDNVVDEPVVAGRAVTTPLRVAEEGVRPLRAGRGCRPATAAHRCGDCGWEPLRDLCACPFRRIDPLRPVAVVLGFGSASSSSSYPGYGRCSFEMQRSTQPLAEAGEGGGVELRAIARDKPGLHVWPRSVTVLFDGIEVAHVAPPAAADRRGGDAPLDLTEHFLTDSPTVLEVIVDGGSRPAADFVFCVARWEPGPSIAHLVDEVCTRPPASADRAADIWAHLLAAESRARGVEEEGVAVLRCESPWLQPLICPLTHEKIRTPARGALCAHVRCFDLEAYLETSARTVFQRRWRCPLCEGALPPSDLVVCGLTKDLLRVSPVGVNAVPLDSVLWGGQGVGIHRSGLAVAATAWKPRKRWRRLVLGPPSEG